MQAISPDAAISIRSVTPAASRRIVDAAFRYAVRHGRRKVTAVHKANVLRATCGVFLEAAREVAAQYPEIQFETANVDAICMWLLKNPLEYDVLVTTNLFGDIISDLCAQLVGGMGFACSGNLGETYAVFEPTHGSAPKYAGQDKVNPLASILAGAIMAKWLGQPDIARRIEKAVAAVIEDGRVRTYDMGGTAGTAEMAGAVAEMVRRIRPAVSPHPALAPEDHRPTEEQVSMRSAIAQRIDSHGSKIEELAGTGVHDAKGG